VAAVVVVARDEESADEEARESLARAGPAGPPRVPWPIAVHCPAQLLTLGRLSRQGAPRAPTPNPPLASPPAEVYRCQKVYDTPRRLTNMDSAPAVPVCAWIVEIRSPRHRWGVGVTMPVAPSLQHPSGRRCHRPREIPAATSLHSDLRSSMGRCLPATIPTPGPPREEPGKAPPQVCRHRLLRRALVSTLTIIAIGLAVSRGYLRWVPSLVNKRHIR
jgi:hypothetical protein